MRRVLPLLAGAALALPGAASAEVVTAAPGAAEAALGVQPDGMPVAGWVDGNDVILARRTAAGWQRERIGTAPFTGRVTRILYGRNGRPYVLVEHVDFAWLRLVYRRGTRWRTVVLRQRGTGGPAGLAIDRAGRAVVAYATWSLSPRPRSTLFLVRERSDGSFATQQVTRRGFPPASSPPSAAPAVLADGSVRVVEAVGEGGRGVVVLSWRLDGGRWWGKVVFANVFGLSLGSVSTVGHGETLDVAWTVLFADGEPTAFYGTPYPRSLVTLALENAVVAGLARTAEGVVLAVNERVQGLVAGRILSPSGAAPELDGLLLGFKTSGQLLLWREGRLEWFASAGLLATRVFLAEPTPGSLSGRVDGAAGGAVAVYDERTNPRTLVANVPLAPDGSFALSAPAGGVYRAVYVHSATGVPYGAVARTSTGVRRPR